MYQISVQTAVCCLEYGNPRGFNALLGMWKEIPAYWYFHIAEILWLSRAFMGGTQVLLDLVHYPENTFSDVSCDKFLNNRGAACRLESH